MPQVPEALTTPLLLVWALSELNQPSVPPAHINRFLPVLDNLQAKLEWLALAQGFDHSTTPTIDL